MVKSELEKLTDCEIAIACHCNFSSTANPQPPNTASHCLPYKCMKAPPGQCNSQTFRDELIVVVVTTHLNSAVSFSSITLKQLGVRQQLQLGRSRVVFCTEISSEVELQYVSELMKSAHVIYPFSFQLPQPPSLEVSTLKIPKSLGRKSSAKMHPNQVIPSAHLKP